MKLDGIIFHGNLDDIERLKFSVRKIPEWIIRDRDMKHGYFDVELSNNFTVLYPRYARVPLKLHGNFSAVKENDFATFRLEESIYKLFYSKEYSEKEKIKQVNM